LREFVKWGARPSDLCGVDALAERIDEAREMCPPGIQLICGNAEALQFEDESFDIVLMFQSMTLMIDDTVRRRVASEALRVLKPGGAILIYDYRYQRPEMKGLLAPVRRRDIHSLFSGCNIQGYSIHPFPPISRRLARVWRPAWHLLDIFPPLRTCNLSVVTKGLVS
jgi:SAM-dependent methyltransferase